MRRATGGVMALIVGTALFAVEARSLEAQVPFGTAIGVSALTVDMRRSSPEGEPEAYVGTLVGIEGALELRGFVLKGSYREGAVDVEGAGEARDLVWGELRAGYRVLPWVTLEAGPTVRTLVSDAGAGDVQLLLWNAGASADLELVPGWVSAFGSISGTLSSSAHLGPHSDGGFSGVAALLAAPDALPIWLSLAYGAERQSLLGTRPEIVESLRLIVGIRLP